MNITLNIDFWLDGMDELIEEELRAALETVLQSGAEATNTDIKIISMDI